MAGTIILPKINPKTSHLQLTTTNHFSFAFWKILSKPKVYPPLKRLLTKKQIPKFPITKPPTTKLTINNRTRD